VVLSALETVQPAATAKEITIEMVFSDSVGLINGDAGRLRQVAWNLLSNAIKFTPRGGAIRISLTRTIDQIELKVRDSGQGIRADFMPYIFDRFRQADASTTRRHGGLGLGLSIVKNLIDLHGGTVRAESDGEGAGSTFILTLPTSLELDRVDQGSSKLGGPAAAIKAFESFGLSGVRVLVVDDEPDACAMVRRLLEECHAHVATAGSADEALRQFDSIAPDVLVCDIGMPGKDGYELIRQIRGRSNESGGSVPAAALTAFAREEDRHRALSAGYQAHLAKPVDAARLLTAIARLAGRQPVKQ
jgi:CheY-like chemotaxis protein/anti-sigma regulatory factor (Ser/Thr protein kinase)